PVKGGPDGGAYVTVKDMEKCWQALFSHQLLNEELTNKLLTPHVPAYGEESFYGYGIWIEKMKGEIYKYHVMGYDPGVNFRSAYYPQTSTITVICSNQSDGAFEMEESISRFI